MGMLLKPSDLLPGEGKVMTKGANLIVSIKEAGLSRFVADKYFWITGMEGKEAIGGLAHLTNYRVIFKSHSINRLRGSYSIFLPNIVSVSTGFNRLYVETEIQRFAFVVWFKTSFIEAVHRQKSALTPHDILKLKDLVGTNPGIIGPGLQKCITLEIINKIASAALKIEDILEKLPGNDKSAFLEFLSLLEK